MYIALLVVFGQSLFSAQRDMSESLDPHASAGSAQSTLGEVCLPPLRKIQAVFTLTKDIDLAVDKLCLYQRTFRSLALKISDHAPVNVYLDENPASLLQDNSMSTWTDAMQVLRQLPQVTMHMCINPLRSGMLTYGVVAKEQWHLSVVTLLVSSTQESTFVRGGVWLEGWHDTTALQSNTFFGVKVLPPGGLFTEETLMASDRSS